MTLTVAIPALTATPTTTPTTIPATAPPDKPSLVSLDCTFVVVLVSSGHSRSLQFIFSPAPLPKSPIPGKNDVYNNTTTVKKA